jgi:CDP-diacylglycerol--serine O-phosphatidyltransferase
MKIKLFTIPNTLTLINLLCGSFAAVTALSGGSLAQAFWLIAAAAVFDFSDGFAARILKSSSAIGEELDSLADVISFGFAPAAILYSIYTQAGSQCPLCISAVGLSLFIMVAFAALRLAKFNIDDTQHTEFCGLPTPAAALFCASLGWLVSNGELPLSREPILVIAVILSALMVSNIRMFALKFKGFGWSENKLRYIFILISIALIALLYIKAVPIIILLYISISAVRYIFLPKANP